MSPILYRAHSIQIEFDSVVIVVVDVFIDFLFS